MLLSRSHCRSARKGWGIRVTLYSWISCWCQGKRRNVSNSDGGGGGGELVLLCFVFRPRISPASPTALGAWTWLCSESLTHDCKGGHIFLELSVLICQACAWKAMWKGKGFPGRNAFNRCAKLVVGNSVLSCCWWHAKAMLWNGLLIFVSFFQQAVKQFPAQPGLQPGQGVLPC